MLAKISFILVDSDLVEIPDELQAVLEQDEKAMQVWFTFPNGLRRSLIHYVTSTKNIDVRIKRSIELLEKAKNGALHTQRSKRN